MFSKSTFSFKNDNVETTNANYPFCHPSNGKSIDFKLPFTISFDLYINDINKKSPSHLLTMAKSDDLDNKDTMSGCQSLKASTQWWEKDNFLTLYIAKNDNTLAIKSYLLQDNFHVKNLPVKQWLCTWRWYGPTLASLASSSRSGSSVSPSNRDANREPNKWWQSSAFDH